MLKIAIIVGTTRPGRKGEAIARWAYEIARKRTPFTDFEYATLFEPTERSEKTLNSVLDHVIAWSGALKDFAEVPKVTSEVGV